MVGLLASASMLVACGKALPDLGEVPDFKFTDHRAVPFGKTDLKGKIWVVDFIFTTCPGPCPAMSQFMSELDQLFLDRPQVAFVSVSVNPAYDTPEVLAEYAKRFRASDKWHFLTGSEEAVLALSVNGFKIGDPNDVIAHSQRFVLVDASQRIRGTYLSSEPSDRDALKNDIEALL